MINLMYWTIVCDMVLSLGRATCICNIGTVDKSNK